MNPSVPATIKTWRHVKKLIRKTHIPRTCPKCNQMFGMVMNDSQEAVGMDGKKYFMTKCTKCGKAVTVPAPEIIYGDTDTMIIKQ